MKKLNSDARSFVKGIVNHLKKGAYGNSPFPKIQTLLRKVSDHAQKENSAKIITAVPLQQQEKELLTQILSRKMNQDINLECMVQPDVLGGIRVEIADYIIDMSYKEKLRAIGLLLLKGNTI